MTRTVCVVLDTNIWRETLLLRSGLGPALLHVIHRRDGRLGLPEVIESEIHKQLLKAGHEAAEEMRRCARDLRVILGTFPETAAPVDDRITAAIASRLDTLAPLMIRHPLTIEQTRAALRRVNDETPPNGPKNQQFKDSLIWEGVLELGRTFDVVFVTKDAGFFKDRDKRELASPLREECGREGVSLSVFSDLASSLEHLRADMPEIDRGLIARAAYDAVREDVARDAAPRALRLGNLVDFQVSRFITEDPDLLAVQFLLTPEVIDLDEEGGRTDYRIRAAGQCSYSLTGGQARDAMLDSIEYQWTDSAGQAHTNKSAYARAGLVIGGRQRDVPHTIRELLP